MNELFPVLAGAAIGAGVLRIAAARARFTALIALCLLAGLAASLVSGELALSWGFVPVDIVQALVAALLMLGVVRVVRRGGLRAR